MCVALATSPPALIAQQSYPLPNMSAIIPDIEKGIAASRIARLECFAIPVEFYTSTQISPEKLRAGACLNMSFREMEDTEFVHSLCRIFLLLKPVAAGHEIDARWGFVFYDDENRERLSIYVGRDGRTACINGQNVLMQKEVNSPLSRLFGSLVHSRPR